jgi:hypothetical protein
VSNTSRTSSWRLRQFIKSNTTERVSAERHNPASEYLSAQGHRAELKHLFPAHPLVVAHASQLNAAGSYVSNRLPPQACLSCATRTAGSRLSCSPGAAPPAPDIDVRGLLSPEFDDES